MTSNLYGKNVPSEPLLCSCPTDFLRSPDAYPITGGYLGAGALFPLIALVETDQSTIKIKHL